ncbi:MAG: 30S ribosomal protein S6 [Acidimicrobiales bacterium]
MRAYELMIIFSADLDESTVQTSINKIAGQAEDAGASVEKIDKWGIRRFAYEIQHKWEGFYVVLEFASPNALDEIDRTLRLADDVIRHKFIRLPLAEAHRRGLTAVTA